MVRTLHISIVTEVMTAYMVLFCHFFAITGLRFNFIQLLEMKVQSSHPLRTMYLTRAFRMKG